MDKIKVKLIDYDSPSIVQEACQMTRSMGKCDDPENFTSGNKWDMEKINKMLDYPHSKIARFTYFKFIVTGASRRFLSQIITHHIGCDIMSGSIQYANLTKNVIPSKDMFVVPYDIIVKSKDNELYEHSFLSNCQSMLELYEGLVNTGIDTDAAGYVLPMSVRNNILIQVNLEELMFIANQRLCRRNTDETRYVVGIMVEAVIKATGLKDSLFMPTCYSRPCPERNYSCGCPLNFDTIEDLLDFDYRYLKDARKGN